MTREQTGVLIQACLAQLDDLWDRCEISDVEWTRQAELLSAKATVWLRDATDGTVGDRVP
jgi:hypothetical protein